MLGEPSARGRCSTGLWSRGVCGNRDDTWGVGGAGENPQEKSEKFTGRTCPCKCLRVRVPSGREMLTFPNPFPPEHKTHPLRAPLPEQNLSSRSRPHPLPHSLCCWPVLCDPRFSPLPRRDPNCAHGDIPLSPGMTAVDRRNPSSLPSQGLSSLDLRQKSFWSHDLVKSHSASAARPTSHSFTGTPLSALVP